MTAEAVAETSIVAFLLARITEDEAVARRAPAAAPGVPCWDLGFVDFDILEVSRERMLAECEAKRQIVMECNAWMTPVDPGLDAEFILQLLAKPYADHPDFDLRWAL